MAQIIEQVTAALFWTMDKVHNFMDGGEKQILVQRVENLTTELNELRPQYEREHQQLQLVMFQSQIYVTLLYITALYIFFFGRRIFRHLLSDLQITQECLSASEDREEALTVENRRLNVMVESLRAQLNELRPQHEDINRQLEVSLVQNQQLDDQFQRLSGDFNQLVDLCTTGKGMLEQVLCELTVTRELLSLTEARVELLSEANSEKETRLKAEEDRQKQLLSQIRRCNGRVQDKQAEVDIEKTLTRTMDQKLRHMICAEEKLQTDWQKEKAEKDGLLEEVRSMKSELEKQKAQLIMESSQKRNLLAMLLQQHAEREAATQRNEALCEHVEALCDHVEQLTADLNKSQEDYNLEKEENETLWDQVESLTETVHDQRKKIDKLKKRNEKNLISDNKMLDEAGKQIRQLDVQLVLERRAKVEQADKVKELESELKTLKEVCQQHEDRQRQFTELLLEKEREIQELKAEKDSSSSGIYETRTQQDQEESLTRKTPPPPGEDCVRL